MFNNINSLKLKGYYPDLICDIGAYHGIWTQNVISIYEKSKYWLFEAIDYDELKRYNAYYPTISVFNALLNEKECEVEWYEKRNTGDSMFKECTHHFDNCQPMKKQSKTLDSFYELLPDNINKILIKIDCQGAEIPILKGASKLLQKTDFIILEIPFFGKYNEGVPTFLEHVQYMDSIGFIPYDMLENHYVKGYNIQIDMMFINKNHAFVNRVNEELKIC